MTRHRARTTAAALTASLLWTVLGTATAEAEPAETIELSSTAVLFGTGSLDFGSLDAPAPDAPRLSSVVNFRDVAGTGAGYTGAGGVHLNKGLFYRSDAIVPNDADLAVLENMGLSTVYDLRSDDEVTDKPNRLPGGIDYVRIPIFSGNVGAMVDQIRSPEDARNMMRGMNRDFATGADERIRFATLLTDLANTDGRQVFHCTTGKDRTGWTAMLLQHIAGVDDATIMSDYLLTNEYNKEWVAETRAYLVATRGEAAVALMEPLFGVEESYLQAGLDELAATYGSVDGYLTDGLGLSTGTIDTLRDKLLA